MTDSSHNTSLWLLTTTAVELRAWLQDGKVTSRELIERSLKQIDNHNQSGMELQAIISTMPKEKALKQADLLDEERRAGIVRGPFHGIPIIVKVSAELSSISSKCEETLANGNL
jgi:amidase